MPKLSGFNRKNIGARNYKAEIHAPPEIFDQFGQIDYQGLWRVVVAEWWCELIDAEGGEVVDGYQTAALTEKIAIGDFAEPSSAGVNSKMRLLIDGKHYQITAVRDVAGRRRDIRIELKAYADK